MAQNTEKPVVLSLKGIQKSFGDNRAVDITQLEVHKGEIFGFLGPNGAGKSTTIRLILDILRPDSGTITLFGKDNRNVKLTHRDIGFLSGDMVLDNDLTGKQYLSLVNNLYGGGHEAVTAELAQKLDAKLDVKIGNYSRGNRQKIGLIAALLHSPQLLILDEPTSGFDPLVQETFADLLRDYVAKGGTVLMSSHILAEVQNLCNRVAFIKGGKIIATTTVSDLLDTSAKRIHISAASGVIRKLHNSYATIAGLSMLESADDKLTFSYTGELQPLLRFFAKEKLRDITIREPELEEIFGQYYAADEPKNTEVQHA